jgi:glycosyltransferase involved in cell wall biosynthesis/nucleotide-binding universal stress UspA family protein
MKRVYPPTIFQKVLVPVLWECDCANALAAARAIAREGQSLVVGIVGIREGESLSVAASPARLLRKRLSELAGEGHLAIRERVRVSHRPWEELIHIVEEEEPDLLLLNWPCQFESMGITAAQALANPPCDMAIVCGPIPGDPRRVLVSIRGGPYAELALRVSLALSDSDESSLTSLHFRKAADTRDAPYRGFERVLSNLPDVERRELVADDPAAGLLAAAKDYEITVLGSTASQELYAASLGAVADKLLQESPAGVIVVKTKRSAPSTFESETVGQTAISVLVDKWFAENTYSAEEFSDLECLLALKRKHSLTISLALPALNEEKTVGEVIRSIKEPLMDRLPILDEIILVDSNSTDHTRPIAQEMGLPVYVHQQVLPHYGFRSGKGEALWKSLYLTRGDIVLWIDTDIVNIHPRFVYGLIGPLLLQPEVQFVKGFYRRPLRVGEKLQAGGGGRVTELTARPLLNLFYPELSGVIQPLSGEYGGRRTALERMAFFSGYGVEIGLLIDAFEQCGLGSIAQVDLRERVHHNQPLESLGKMSFAIIQAVIHKLERRYGQGFLEDVNKTMKLIRYEPGRFFLDIEEIAEQVRPPMVDLPEYRERFKR